MVENKSIKYTKCVLNFEGGRIVINDQSTRVDKNGINKTVGAHAKIIDRSNKKSITVPVNNYQEIVAALDKAFNEQRAREFIQKIGEQE